MRVLQYYLFLLISLVIFKSNAETVGIIQNGKILTIRAAGIKLPVVPIYQDLSAINYIIKKIKGLEIRDILYGRFIKNLLPSQNRKYFKITKISEQEKLKLVESYRLVLSIKAEDSFTLFAFTKDDNTYLLPSFFYENDINQQGIILFQEALKSMLGRNLNLNFQLKLQFALESYIQCSVDCIDEKIDFIRILMSAVDEGSRRLTLINIMAKYDFQHKAMYQYDFFDQQGKITLQNLIGIDLYDEMVLWSNTRDANNDNTWKLPLNDYLWKVHLHQMINIYPQSLLWKELYNQSENLTLGFSAASNYSSVSDFRVTSVSDSKMQKYIKDPLNYDFDTWDEGVLKGLDHISFNFCENAASGIEIPSSIRNSSPLIYFDDMVKIKIEAWYSTAFDVDRAYLSIE